MVISLFLGVFPLGFNTPKPTIKIIFCTIEINGYSYEDFLEFSSNQNCTICIFEKFTSEKILRVSCLTQICPKFSWKKKNVIIPFYSKWIHEFSIKLFQYFIPRTVVGHLSTSMLEGAFLFFIFFFELISVWIGPIAPIYQQRWDPCLYSHFPSSFFFFLG